MFSTSELTEMRRTQEAHMMDACVIYHVTSKVKDSRGQYAKVFDEGIRSICGVQMAPLAMSAGESMVTADIDCILRLPLGTVIKPGDEVEIIERFGAEVPARRYEVQQYSNDGPSGCRVTLKVRNVQ